MAAKTSPGLRGQGQPRELSSGLLCSGRGALVREGRAGVWEHKPVRMDMLRLMSMCPSVTGASVGCLGILLSRILKINSPAGQMKGDPHPFCFLRYEVLHIATRLSKMEPQLVVSEHCYVPGRLGELSYIST